MPTGLHLAPHACIMWLAILLFIILIFSFTLMGLQFAAPKDMGIEDSSEDSGSEPVEKKAKGHA